MLTEQEAREKWCPFARTTMYVRGDVPEAESPTDMIGHAANRLVTDDVKLNASIQKIIKDVGATRCIASDCMAWRWGEPRSEETRVPAGSGKPNGYGWEISGVSEKYDHGTFDVWVRIRPGRVGYCGLAGKPDV